LEEELHGSIVKVQSIKDVKDSKLEKTNVPLSTLEFNSLARVFQILKEIRDTHNSSSDPDWITFDEYESNKNNKNV